MATNTGIKKTVTKTDVVFDDKIITLRSVYDKANIKYMIMPCKNKYGQYPSCIKRVNSQGDMIMSEKERAIQLLDKVPEYKMGYVLAYIQGITADEDADDRFCEKMIQDYNNSPDEDKEDMTLEECKKEWGLD